MHTFSNIFNNENSDHLTDRPENIDAKSRLISTWKYRRKIFHQDLIFSFCLLLLPIFEKTLEKCPYKDSFYDFDQNRKKCPRKDTFDQ